MVPAELIPEPELAEGLDQIPEIEDDLAEIFAEDLSAGAESSITATVQTGVELTEEMPVSAAEANEAVETDAEKTMLAQGEEPSHSRATASQALDLQALVETAHADDKLSETLMEALTLLERDYEQELTASQMMDRERLDKMLDGEEDDDGDNTESIDRKMTG